MAEQQREIKNGNTKYKMRYLKPRGGIASRRAVFYTAYVGDKLPLKPESDIPRSRMNIMEHSKAIFVKLLWKVC